MNKSVARQLYSSEVLTAIEGVLIGRIIRISGEGIVLVKFAGAADTGVAARATRTVMTTLRASDPSGCEVLLAFENNDPRLPVIIDTMHSLLDEVATSTETVLETDKPEDVLIDGRRITFDAQEEVVLRCGKSSIILTRAGKVLIRGAYLLSRSSGVNRIKGGSVQIN